MTSVISMANAISLFTTDQNVWHKHSHSLTHTNNRAILVKTEMLMFIRNILEFYVCLFVQYFSYTRYKAQQVQSST